MIFMVAIINGFPFILEDFINTSRVRNVSTISGFKSSERDRVMALNVFERGPVVGRMEKVIPASIGPV